MRVPSLPTGYSCVQIKARGVLESLGFSEETAEETEVASIFLFLFLFPPFHRRNRATAIRHAFHDCEKKEKKISLTRPKEKND